MWLSSRAITTTLMVVLVIVIVMVAGVGYLTLQGLPSTPSNGSVSSSSSVSMLITSVVGNYQTESVSISNNTEVDVTCNYCSLTFNLNSGIILSLNVVGNSNEIAVSGGSTNLSGSGNDNTFSLQNTKVLSDSLTGNSNSVD